MEGEVKPWVKKRISDEIRKMYMRFDGFEQWITQQLEGIYSPNLAKVQAKLAELRKLVDELHDRPIL